MTGKGCHPEEPQARKDLEWVLRTLEPGPSLRSGRQPEPGPSLTLRTTNKGCHPEEPQARKDLGWVLRTLEPGPSLRSGRQSEPGPSLRSGRQPEPDPSLTLRMTEIQAHLRRSGRQAMDFPVKLTFLPLRNTIACGIFFSQL